MSFENNLVAHGALGTEKKIISQAIYPLKLHRSHSLT